jgi:ribonucleoside-diphosphate reductase alpha chain
MPGLLDEIKKNVNRPVPELPISDETEILIQPAARASGGNGNGNGHADHAASAGARVSSPFSQQLGSFQSDAPTCPNCGYVAVRNGACYKCLNCGESLGCS